MKTVALELTIPEIVLIKECIFDALSKNQLARQKYSGRMPAYDIAAKGQQENLQTLSNKLAPYGYGM